MQRHHAKARGESMVHANDYQAGFEAIEPRLLMSADISLLGGPLANQEIQSGDTTPIFADFTDFGHMRVSDDGSIVHEATRLFTIKNAGDGTLNLTGSPVVTISGADAADFVVTTQPASASLGEGETTTFMVTFNPSVADERRATITITSDDADEASYSFDIVGLGVDAVSLYGGVYAGTTDPGSGAHTTLGEKIQVHYALYEADGTFHETSAGGDPFEFDLGYGQVIDGWEIGLPGMAVGESRTLIIPPAMAYGDSGHSLSGRTLIFEVYLEDVTLPLAQPPEIGVAGNGQDITDGDSTPSAADDTDFGAVPAGVQVTHIFEISASHGQGTFFMLGNPYIQLLGPDAGHFSVGEFIFTDSTLQFPVTFTAPQDAGAYQAQVMIPSTDPDESRLSFMILGATDPTYAPDDFEANDTADAATDLGTGNQTLTDLNIHQAGDVDWYEWTPTTEGTTRVTLTFEDEEGPLVVQVYNTQGQLLSTSHATSGGQVLWLTGVPGEPVRLKVSNPEGLSQPEYQMAIREIVPGDFNNDGRVDVQDINPFVLALSDLAAYQAQFPGVVLSEIDPNGDGVISVLDITPFSSSLTKNFDLFDEGWYLAVNPDVAADVGPGKAWATAFEHYLTIGQQEGRSPSPYFDEAFYLERNPDVAADTGEGKIWASGYAHYLAFGQHEGRNPTPYFNEVFYLAQNPDVAASVAAGSQPSGYLHFVHFGQTEGRLWSPIFDEAYYLASNPDVVADIGTPALRSAFHHFMYFGRYEGRAFSAVYDEAYYLAQNPDVAADVGAGKTWASGFEHFLAAGQFEARAYSPYYSETAYLLNNPDVAAEVGPGLKWATGFEHYVLYGQFEGRIAV
ncbi:MAG: choice-of-anchor D domain-containing protein [Phycisphaeraceae bacterium]|nr:choice-of-anchor D domain-containing protein [Phycisphaeraceae bacterium]